MKKENQKDDFDDVVIEDDDESVSFEKKDKVSKLKEKFTKCQEEKQEYLDNWQRAQADFLNLRRRDEEDKQKAIKFAKQELIEEVISVLDSFDMAFGNKEVWEKAPEEWREGMTRIHTQLENILTKNGLEKINPLGERFDPGMHDAVSSQKVTEEDDEKVMQVVQAGYRLHEKVIRPAKVVVGAFQE